MNFTTAYANRWVLIAAVRTGEGTAVESGVVITSPPSRTPHAMLIAHAGVPDGVLGADADTVRMVARRLAQSRRWEGSRRPRCDVV